MLALESLLFQLCLILSAKVVDPLSGRRSKDEGGVSTVEVPPNVGPTIKASAASQVESAMAALSVELSKLRTGRASTGMLDHIIVETGGVKMHLNRFALVSVLDQKTLSVNPYDPETLKQLENAIVSSPLGLNPKTDVPLPEGVVESLMNGELRLPCSEKFSLPPPVPCPGGCGEAYYCSMLCAEADWESSHSLLCIGESSDPRHREELFKFMKHANETNDIFLLAAKTTIISIFFWKLGDLYQWDTKRGGRTALHYQMISILPMKRHSGCK
ncbi:hypothetical protein KIW84_011836 [Lathyrus oleraceus]|uniref:Ribosome-releasing factor, chloroplastic n=1 Tax=Pisum sativum TaxID=3888 RepID=A0A9D5BFZ5_PEA|nr:hypothetical protein KIW84_011836 [Pisum sativum]